MVKTTRRAANEGAAGAGGGAGSGRARSAPWALAFLLGASIGLYPVILATPLYFGLPTRWFTVPMRVMVVAVALAVVLLSKSRFRLNVGISALATFALLYAMRLLHDTELGDADLSLPGWEYWAYLLGVCVIPGLATLRTDWRTDVSYRCVPVTLLVTTAVSSAWLTFMYRDVFGWGIARLGQIPVALSPEFDTVNPLTMSYLAALQIAIGLELGMRFIHGRRWWAAALCGGAGFLGVLPLAMGASRGPAVFLLLAIVGLVAVWQRGAIRVIVGIIGIVGLLVWILELLEAAYGWGLVERIAGIGADWEDRTAAVERFFVWDRAWSAFLAEPFTGYGLETPGYAIYPHNAVIEAFMATGVVGGTAFSLSVVYCLVWSLRMARQNQELVWVALVCWWGVVQAMFSGAVYSSGALWMGLTLTLGMVMASRPHGALPRLGPREEVAVFVGLRR